MKLLNAGLSVFVLALGVGCGPEGLNEDEGEFILSENGEEELGVSEDALCQTGGETRKVNYELFKLGENGIELRYSPSCRTVWARFTLDGSPAQRAFFLRRFDLNKSWPPEYVGVTFVGAAQGRWHTKPTKKAPAFYEACWTFTPGNTLNKKKPLDEVYCTPFFLLA